MGHQLSVRAVGGLAVMAAPAASSYPKAAAIPAMLGEARLLTGDRPGALAAFRKAAELLPGDETVGGLRAYWKSMTEKGLEDLGRPETPPKSQ